MAFTDIRETTKNSASLSVDDRQRNSGKVSRTFDLLSDSPATDESIAAVVALGSVGVTDTGELINSQSRHPLSYFFSVDGISVERTTPIIYTATVTYRTPIFTEKDNPDGDPELEPPRIEFSSVGSEEGVDEDADGEPLATPTGELYQGFTTEFEDLAVTITKRYALFDPYSFYVYNNKVNSDEFMRFPAGTAKCKISSVKPEVIGDQTYWAVTVQITFREPINTTEEKAWYRRFKLQGFDCFEPGSTEKRVRCVDANGEPVTQPVALDENGYQITADNPANEVWLERPKYSTIAFAGMNLGV